MQKKYETGWAFLNAAAYLNRFLDKKEDCNHEDQKFRKKTDIKQKDHCEP
jgi:hypothetical protein